MGLNRSSYYLSPATESEENLRLMRLIDQQFLRTPFYGSRRMTASLERSGETVNRKRVQRLMALMGLDAIFPKPRTTVAAPDARVYPYLLRDRVLTHVNEVWSSDITYVPMRHGFMYLTAVIDWFSRYVLLWRLSNTLEGQFCLEALDEALSMGRPEIFNTDQGSQFTARDYTRFGDPHRLAGFGRLIDEGGSAITSVLDLQECTEGCRGTERAGSCGEPSDGRSPARRLGVQPASQSEDQGRPRPTPIAMLSSNTSVDRCVPSRRKTNRPSQSTPRRRKTSGIFAIPGGSGIAVAGRRRSVPRTFRTSGWVRPSPRESMI